MNKRSFLGQSSWGKRPRALPLESLAQSESGLALVEFAITLPFLLVLATSGLELTNYALTVKQIGELSVMVADNASRMGSQTAINNKPVSEAEINDVFIGADLQASSLKMGTNGRIILSSLQQNEQGGQTIKWQRCFGGVSYSSVYGPEGTGATGTSFAGVGPTGGELKAAPGTAVMVVEIRYRYQRLLPLIWLPLHDITEMSAFNVRDSRDITQVYNTENVTPSTCS
ncbi:TadE/TadG family type IV pilus assembly protein [Sphingobium sp. DC-2]|uniref:TadE/TadG family type IV pilus assembly protein n=1 Tax=Sphingobium sp. DC-2 TaxID=1303256 RepID=UPI00068C5EE3|nr:pilus assembly protein [Sphingobium sp. DC-2]